MVRTDLYLAAASVVERAALAPAAVALALDELAAMFPNVARSELRVAVLTAIARRAVRPDKPASAETAWTDRAFLKSISYLLWVLTGICGSLMIAVALAAHGMFSTSL